MNMTGRALFSLLVLGGVASPLGAIAADAGSRAAAASLPERVRSALESAGANRPALEAALERVPAAQRAGLEFLIAEMPPPDLGALSAELLLETTDLAYRARAEAPWGRALPDDIFLNDVLPYAFANERRDRWRAKLREEFLPLVSGCKTPGAAARRLNETIFARTGVRYSTKRRKADQSALESMESGLASCTGLSILLGSACRAVGVPARLAGTPLWVNRRGNHTWLEVWDDGWHFVGAAEPDPKGLDHGWFAGIASRAVADSRLHAIYATSFRRTGLSFPLVWARRIRWVPAVNVTARYTGAAEPRPDAADVTRLLIRVLDRPGGRRVEVAVEVVDTEDATRSFKGTSRGERADANHFLEFEVARGRTCEIRVAGPAGPVRKQAKATGEERLVEICLTSPREEARRIREGATVRGGLVAHVGCGDGELTAALAENERYLVHGLTRDPRELGAARKRLRSAGLHGRVSVGRLGSELPYADGTVNLLVLETEDGVAPEEVDRVLAPGAVLVRRLGADWSFRRRPRSPRLDDWTHALHSASGNAVSSDLDVAPPARLRWVGAPRNARHHERLASVTVVVSAGGRLFYVADEAPAASILIPPRWSLVARDAHSGVILWRRAIPTWEPYMRSFRSGPPALSRRLVARGDRVYVTLGTGAPVEVLDAESGATIRALGETEGAEEMVLAEETLFVVLGPAPKEGRAAGRDGRDGRDVIAIDPASGRVRWRRPDASPLPMSLAVAGKRAAFLAEDGVVCLDAATGDETWRAGREVARRRPGWSVPTLVIQDDVILCADRQAAPASTLDELSGESIPRWLADGGAPGDLVAYSAADGEVLWTCRCAETYHAPVDVFVSDGLVWVGQSRARTGPVDFGVGRDLHTGEIRRRIEPRRAFQTTMPHHRCHRNRATSRFIVAGRTGVEFIDLATGDAFRHHWVRGVCQYGVVPANGLLYVPPHSCACYIEAKLTGFLALAPAPAADSAGLPREPHPGDPTRGPAWGMPLEPRGPTTGWPTYRRDASRSGTTEDAVADDLRVLWRAELGGRLTSPVVADGRAYVASVDEHTLHCLGTSRGESLWSFTTEGRIDSPPTIARGRVVFGSADGHVYCLRTGDGELVWSVRLAPAERRVFAFGQLESKWPVPGNVLVADGRVHAVAGRSSYLDGGLHLASLDLESGRVLAHRILDSRGQEEADQPEEPRSFEMPGALPDVLSSDGELLFLREQAFDMAGLESRETRPHLYSPAGFLNGDWWHRTYWVYGRHFYSGYIGWYFAGREVPAGRLLVTDPKSIYGFSYRPESYRGATGRRYHLFAADLDEQADQPPADYRRASRAFPHGTGGEFRVTYRWTRNVPLLARALVRARDRLFLAGPPESALRSESSLAGEEGSILAVVSAADGEDLALYRLDAPPVHDGMAAAEGRLFLSTESGALLCLGEDAARPEAKPLPRVAATPER